MPDLLFDYECLVPPALNVVSLFSLVLSINKCDSFSVVSEAEVAVFLNSLAFFMIQRMLVIFFSLPPPPYVGNLISGSCALAQTHVHWVSDAIQPSHPLSRIFSCPQSFPASGSFPVIQHFASGGQSIETSVSASVLPVNVQGWFPLKLTGLISLQSMGLSRVFSSTTVQKHQLFGTQPSLWSNSYICTWLLEKS